MLNNNKVPIVNNNKNKNNNISILCVDYYYWK